VGADLLPAKGTWPHANVSLLLALVIGAPTFGAGSLLVGLGYAVFSNTVVRNHYLKNGWVQVDE
jgi:hypothetical protein